MKGSFDLGYFLKGAGPEDWFKALGLGTRFIVVILIVGLLAAGGISIWRFIFPVPDKQINRPRVYALPGSKIEKIDQSNVQVLMEEKKWAVSAGGGLLRWDNRDGWIIGVGITRKW